MQPQSDGSSSSTATQNKILTVIINNARDTNTVDIDFTGKNIQYLNPNANYTMMVPESHINSGVMLPEDQADPEAPPNSKFTITFDNQVRMIMYVFFMMDDWECKSGVKDEKEIKP